MLYTFFFDRLDGLWECFESISETGTVDMSKTGVLGQHGCEHEDEIAQ